MIGISVLVAYCLEGTKMYFRRQILLYFLRVNTSKVLLNMQYGTSIVSIYLKKEEKKVIFKYNYFYFYSLV